MDSAHHSGADETSTPAAERVAAVEYSQNSVKHHDMQRPILQVDILPFAILV